MFTFKIFCQLESITTPPRTGKLSREYANVQLCHISDCDCNQDCVTAEFIMVGHVTTIVSLQSVKILNVTRRGNELKSSRDKTNKTV